MKSKRTIRILAVALTMIMVIGSVGVYATSAGNINNAIDKKEDQLEQGQEDYAAVNKRMEALSKTIATSEAAVSAINAKIANANSQIAVIVEQLRIKKEDIEKKTEGLNLRLRNMYKNGSVGFMDILLSSGDVSELITNVELVKKIYLGDKELVTALKREYAIIEKDQIRLEEIKAELDVDKKQLDVEKAELSAAKAKLAKERSTISAKNLQLEKDIRKLQAEADRITGEIQGGQSGGDYAGGGMMWPTTTQRISSYFGPRTIGGSYDYHTGIDFPVRSGSSVYAVNGGTVMKVVNGSTGYGRHVIVDHGGGVVTLYAHNSSLLVSKGQTVSKGQVIAKSGNTGWSTGPHLHFEVRINGKYVNPLGYL